VGDNVAYGLHEHYRHQMTEKQIRERVDWAVRGRRLKKLSLG
jgi:phospholipid/cholesterol/gamma-HCH transport system ATP-binding protein